MRRWTRGLALTLALGCGLEAGAQTIAVVPKGTTHEFWRTVQAGALKAGRELGVEIIWKGPQREDDREQQIQLVEDFVSRKVDGIVLAPLDQRALARPVREARDAGIPTVVFDSDLEGTDHVSFVATDNDRGGALAAEHLGGLLGGRGRVALLRYLQGSASNTRREEGFLRTLRERFPEIELISSNLYAGATVEGAYQQAEGLLNRFPALDGVFCPNAPVTIGMLRALEDAGRAGRVRFVGFDATTRLIEALVEEKIDALVVQDPMAIGEIGVRTLVAHLRGEAVPTRIATPLALVSRENLATPAVRRLLDPDFPPPGD